ncbi:MAG: sugar transferase [Bacteroidetes bacterium]|nr:sugar transferase [Bacteroidota bacterium]
MHTKTWKISLFSADLISAVSSWCIFFYLRKELIEGQSFYPDENFYYGAIMLPILWLLFYFMQGTYHEVRRLFRIKILNLTTIASVFGSIVLFFTLLLDDKVRSYSDYYQLFLLVFITHYLCTLMPRLIIVTLLISSIRKKGSGFKTLIIGGNEKALDLFQEISTHPKNVNDFIGFVNVNGKDRLLEPYISYLGHEKNLESVMLNTHIEEIIIAIEATEHDRLKNILLRIDDGKKRIKLLPDTFEILSGSIKMTNIFGVALIELFPDPMPYWQQATKRLIDFVFSSAAILLLIPSYLFSALAVKLSSPGPIFFLQERVGTNGKVFKIVKFRTMYVDAEKFGPQLSSENDLRITKIGRFMRKTRLDEFPQFFNVLVGHMSLVGPRPERKFYIDQIIKCEPQYLQLTRVRPGITSWGQVKYGYAENVDQMLQRMKYDLIYLKNRSLALDIKIMMYTILIVLKAKGK